MSFSEPKSILSKRNKNPRQTSPTRPTVPRMTSALLRPASTTPEYPNPSNSSTIQSLEIFPTLIFPMILTCPMWPRTSPILQMMDLELLLLSTSWRCFLTYLMIFLRLLRQLLPQRYKHHLLHHQQDQLFKLQLLLLLLHLHHHLLQAHLHLHLQDPLLLLHPKMSLTLLLLLRLVHLLLLLLPLLLLLLKEEEVYWMPSERLEVLQELGSSLSRRGKQRRR